MWFVMGMGEKLRKIPCLVALPSPIYDVEAGPTLNGRGI